jgi:hypothetical protein
LTLYRTLHSVGVPLEVRTVGLAGWLRAVRRQCPAQWGCGGPSHTRVCERRASDGLSQLRALRP